MSNYYSCSNPCFSGDSLVLMSNGTKKYCSDIKKGDKIKTPLGFAKIICVIKTFCKDEKEDLVIFDNGLKITPYHPIRVNNVWKFPCDISDVVYQVSCPFIFSFVLDSHHSMFINDMECVTLGHNFTDDVVSHPYFGSNAIINDLKSLSGWDNGLICFYSGCMVKDSNSELVCGFNFNSLVTNQQERILVN